MPISDSVKLEGKVTIFHPTLVNLYGCDVGDGSRIGAFVEIQKGAVIGRRCKISSHTFICEGVTIEDECFIGHGVMFTNDRFPRATNPDGSPQSDADWSIELTRVKRRACASFCAATFSSVRALSSACSETKCFLTRSSARTVLWCANSSAAIAANLFMNAIRCTVTSVSGNEASNATRIFEGPFSLLTLI